MYNWWTSITYPRKQSFLQESTADDQEQAAQWRRMIGLKGKVKRGLVDDVIHEFNGHGFTWGVEFTRRKGIKRARRIGATLYRLDRGGVRLAAP